MSRCASLEPSRTYRRKLFYKIAEVAEIVAVEPYVLRYWETRFPMLKPDRLPNDERRYRQRDVDLLLKIRELLYEEKFTIPGAVEQLRDRRRGKSPAPVQADHTAAPDLFGDDDSAATATTEIPQPAVILAAPAMPAAPPARVPLGNLLRELSAIRQELYGLRSELGD